VRSLVEKSATTLTAAFALVVLGQTTILVQSADAHPVILPGGKVVAGHPAWIEIVAPKGAAHCSITFRGDRQSSQYRVKLGGPTRLLHWTVSHGVHGTWSAQLSCRGRRHRRLGSASRRLVVGSRGPGRGRLVTSGSFRSGPGSIPELRTTRASTASSEDVDTTIGVNDPTKFSACQGSFWLVSTRTTGDGVGTFVQAVPNRATRLSTLNSSREDDPTYLAIWDDVKACSHIGTGLTASQWHSLYMQLACHARYGVTAAIGGNTWDLEAWRKDVPWSQGLSIGGSCGQRYGDVSGAAAYVRGRLVNSFPAWEDRYGYDNPRQRAAWLIDDSLQKRHVTTVGAYGCLLTRGKSKASWFPKHFMETYLTADGPDLADAEACGSGQLPRGTPRLAIVGSCTTAGGTLTSTSSGFTPGATATIRAWYPDGHEYSNLAHVSRVRADGSLGWVWPCAGDPSGAYTTSAVDDATGASTGTVAFTIGGALIPPLPPPPPQTWSEQETPNHPVNTFTNYHNASGMGPAIAAGQWVQVSCKVYDPFIASVNPDGYWYRIASSPWNNAYYSPANTFMNGDPYGGPYTHNTDFAVPNC
jgi:hypothetical protein